MWFWIKLGFINFGGPAGQIAIMHEELVERRRWIANDRFMHALNFCTLLPGPEAQQLAIYIGWLLHKTRGGLIAGIAFVLPAAFLLWGLSWIYAVHGDVSWIAATFYGLRAVVIAIVLAAVVRIGKQSLRHPALLGLAGAAFFSLFFLEISFPLVVIGAALAGAAASRFWPSIFARSGGHSAPGSGPVSSGPDLAMPILLRRSLIVLIVGLAAWWLPLLAVVAWRGESDVLSQQAFFFSKAALVTFGGAYAVLAYIGQAAVEQYGWLREGEMLDGLGLAESTPGPLIMVTEFVGFIGAYRNNGNLEPALMGTLGAAVTVWATFAPCFLWIFFGAPFVERLRSSALLASALAAITASVVGVILNLAVWLGLHALFGEVEVHRYRRLRLLEPHLLTLDVFILVLALAAFLGMRYLRWQVIPVVAGGAIAGLVYRELLL